MDSGLIAVQGWIRSGPVAAVSLRSLGLLLPALRSASCRYSLFRTRAQRKPRLPFRSDGSFPLRTAERTLRAT